MVRKARPGRPGLLGSKVRPARLGTQGRQVPPGPPGQGPPPGGRPRRPGLVTAGGAPGAGAAAVALDPLIGPTGPPQEHHPGALLQAGYRQYDQQLINAGFQPPPPPPGGGAGAVAAVPAPSYMRDLAVGAAAEGAQMGAAAVAGSVAQGLVARALAQSAPASR